MHHEFEAIRLWEQPTEIFLQRPGLLPYAVLSQASNRAAILREVAVSIDAVPDRQQQSNLAAASGILAGLILDKQMIQRILRRELMQESVIYQELREEAREEVREEVREAVREEVREQVREEERLEGERSLVLRLLTRKVGELPAATKSQIETLNLIQLESLGEALLDFETLTDLSNWLEH